MNRRRGRGEGALYQRHDHPTCPPLDTDRNRPDHRCRGRWIKTIDFGWTAGARRRKVLYGNTKSEVLQKEKDLQTKTGHIRPTNKTTVEAWMTYWITNIAPERCRPQTLTSYESKINSYIIPLLGRHRLDQLQPRHVRDMYTRLRMPCPSPNKCGHSPSHGLSESTLRQTHAILRRALTIAVRERMIVENVATLIDPPTTATTKRERLTVPEARLALETAKEGHHISRWYAALHQGMRQGECLGLAWAMVNFDQDTITIARTLVKTTGGVAFGSPKSESSKRTIPMTPHMSSHLRVHWARYVTRCEAEGREPDLAALVWCQPSGVPIGHKTDWERWKRFLTNAGVPHVSLHSARNTTAALLEEAGVPARLAAEILGHSSVDQTYAYQKDAGLENRRAAMAALEAAWSKVREMPAVEAGPGSVDPGFGEAV